MLIKLSTYDHILQLILHYSFKEVLTSITCSKSNTLQFMRKHGILRNEVTCPGPSINGARSFACGNHMVCKKTKDTKDEEIWRCRKVHTVVKGNMEFSGMKLLAQGLVLTVPDPLHVVIIWSARKQKTQKMKKYGDVEKSTLLSKETWNSQE